MCAYEFVLAVKGKSFCETVTEILAMILDVRKPLMKHFLIDSDAQTMLPMKNIISISHISVLGGYIFGKQVSLIFT
jgi:hypothetical protein